MITCHIGLVISYLGGSHLPEKIGKSIDIAKNRNAGQSTANNLDDNGIRDKENLFTVDYIFGRPYIRTTSIQPRSLVLDNLKELLKSAHIIYTVGVFFSFISRDIQCQLHLPVPV